MSKKGLATIICLILMFGCSRPSSIEDLKDFSYKVEFSPSFISPCKMEFLKNDSISQFKLIIYNYVDTALTISMIDSIKLNNVDFDNFFKSLGHVDLLKMKTSENKGLDGIGVRNFVRQGSSRNDFYFWSPDKRTREHKIVEALMTLSRKKFTDLNHTEYFEQLEQYFDFGLPCVITNRDPLEIRIYGSLSANEERDLNQFIDVLPSDEPILVDMTNFNGMGTLLYPIFRRLIKRNERIVWIITNKEELLNIGVDKNRIVKDVSLGRELIRESYSH